MYSESTTVQEKEAKSQLIKDFELVGHDPEKLIELQNQKVQELQAPKKIQIPKIAQRKAKKPIVAESKKKAKNEDEMMMDEILCEIAKLDSYGQK